jgi:hypothetical protein
MQRSLNTVFTAKSPNRLGMWLKGRALAWHVKALGSIPGRKRSSNNFHKDQIFFFLNSTMEGK